EPVIGLGDHVPAFLLREVKIKKTPARKTTKSAKVSETESDRSDVETAVEVEIAEPKSETKAA
ncbi:MAG: hypothetical protein ACFBRM_10340, partial [Pikeienuella sp.]